MYWLSELTTLMMVKQRVARMVRGETMSILPVYGRLFGWNRLKSNISLP